MQLRFVQCLMMGAMFTLISAYASADDTHRGRLVEIGNGKLTMTDVDGKNRHTHNLAADLKVHVNGTAARLDDLQKDTLINVVIGDRDGKKVVTKIEVGGDKRTPGVTSSNKELDKPGAPATRASKLIGTAVKNSSGEDLGKIEDIVLQPHDGKVRYAVLSFGGFLGLGDKWFAVPWRFMAIEFEKDKKDKFYFVYNVDKEKLKNAPGFDKNNWPDFGDSKGALEIDTYYGDRVNR